MIYLDNAATGGFKPVSVIENTCYTIKYLNANAGRSGHRLSKTGAELVYNARKTLANFFNNNCPERVIFTKNCTEALNVAILGMIKKGEHVITSIFEHNSVLRPLNYLKEQGFITLTIISPKNNRFLTPFDIENHLTKNTSTAVLNYVSNVTGAINEIPKIGELLRENNIKFIVDGAQACGHFKIDILNDKINALAVAGHKGLNGILGSGALIFDENTIIENVFSGGTGTETFNLLQPEFYPEKLEAGTLNLPAICSLYEGVLSLEDNIASVGKQLKTLSKFLIDALTLNDKVKVYSYPNEAGVVSFEINGISSMEVAEILSNDFDIAVRGGFHCAPLIHKFLNTNENGLVRASISTNNTTYELKILIEAVNFIAKNL